MPANKIKLEICGSNYVIATTDTEEYVLSLAEKLDSDMKAKLAAEEARREVERLRREIGYLKEKK